MAVQYTKNTSLCFNTLTVKKFFILRCKKNSIFFISKKKTAGTLNNTLYNYIK